MSPDLEQRFNEVCALVAEVGALLELAESSPLTPGRDVGKTENQ